MSVHGHVAPGFEPVREAFEANFAEDLELGAGFAAYLDGDLVVDLTGGWADRARTRAWDAQTLVPVYSTTKGIAAIALAMVLEAEGETHERPVADIWPAFGANGKGAVTIGELLSHQAGLPGFVEPVDPAIWLDPPAAAAALAALPPLWPPGSAHGYHPLSWGYLVGEIAQRLSGESLGTLIGRVFRQGLGIDFWLGLPASEHGRCAEAMRPRAVPEMGEINEATRAAFLTKWAAPDRGGAIWREIEIPSANGHGGARAVAALYGVYAGRGAVSGTRALSDAMFGALTRRRVIGQDLVLPYVTEFAAGVMRNNLGIYGPNPETLAHSGWGGSMGLGDPDRGLSAAYVMNRQSVHLQGDPRARRLVDALYGCL